MNGNLWTDTRYLELECFLNIHDYERIEEHHTEVIEIPRLNSSIDKVPGSTRVEIYYVCRLCKKIKYQ